MDSVLYATLMVAAWFAVPAIGGAIAYKIKQSESKRKNKKKLAQIKKQNSPEYKKEKAEKRKLQQELRDKTAVIFRGKKSGKTHTEILKHDEKTPVINQLLIKGKVVCQCPDGVVRRETIYLMQPKYKKLDGTDVGPFLTKDGNLQNDPYVLRDAQTGEILRADMPRVEAISGIPFDFIKGSPAFSNPNLKGILTVDVQRDAKGNIVPVNLENKKELEEFKTYATRFGNRTKDDIALYYEGIIDAAKETYVERKNRTIETYDVDFLFDDDKDEKKTQQQQQIPQDDNGFDFYDRYNYHRPAWMGERGTDYSYNFELSDYVFGPDEHGHGGPRR